MSSTASSSNFCSCSKWLLADPGLTSFSCSVCFFGLHEARFSLTTNSTATRRITTKAEMEINTTCQTASFLSFCKYSVLDTPLPMTVTVNESSSTFLSWALGDTLVAVTFTCVTMPGVASKLEVRINRHEVACVVLRVTVAGRRTPFIEEWLLNICWRKTGN